MYSKRKYRKEIARETVNWCEKNHTSFTHLTASKFHRKQIPSEAGKPPEFETKLEIVNMDTLDATLYYQDSDKKNYCLLNMASSSPHQFGGGYLNGSLAQEEDLCRRTNFHSAFKKMKPPVPKYGGCFIKNLLIIRENEASGYKWMERAVATSSIMCAAPRHPELKSNGDYVPKEYEEMRKKIMAMFDLLLMEKQYYIVLGAFGCGAYYNPPHEVAKIFRNLLNREYKGRFAKVVFAILDNRGTSNRNIFEEIIKLK